MTYTFTCCDDGSGNTVGTIVRFDNVTILIDPGWFSSKVSYEDSVKYWSNLIPEVNIILLSQSSVDCIGAYAMLYHNFLPHFISRIQVYATLPVTNLGRVSTFDLYASRGLVGPYDTNEIDVDDVEKAFEHIESLKYSQLVDLRSKFDGLTLVAYNSGVSPGGSIWCISTYLEKLIYARRWNHTRDTILNGASLLDGSGKPISTLLRPSAIITTFEKFGSSRPHARRMRYFKDTMKQALTSNGSILIPVEMGGNFLDLLVSVHDFLYESAKNKLYSQVPVILVSYSRGRALTYAKSMLEWMSSSAIKTWESRDNRTPFDLGRRFHVATPEELTNYSGSKICFVSQVDSLVDEAIKQLCQLERATVILPGIDQAYPSALSILYKKWEQAFKQQNLEEGKPVSYSGHITLKNIKLDPLVNKDLEHYKEQIIERRDKRQQLTTTLIREAKKTNSIETFAGGAANGQPGALGLGGIGEGEFDDEEEEDNLMGMLRDGTTAPTGKQNAEIPTDIYIQEGAPAKHRMFPFQPQRIKRDDYGSIIDFSMLIPSEDDGNTTKRPSSEEIEEEKDPYDLMDPRRVTVKRSRKDDAKNNSSKIDENWDSIEYLDAMKDPVKRVESSSKVNVKCMVTFINLESLVDQRSATVIWPALKPKKILLLGPAGTQIESSMMTLRKREIELTAMPLNKDVQFDTTIKSLDISVDPELDQLLKWQSISDGYTVAHVIGKLVKEKPQAGKSQQQAQEQKQQLHRTRLVLKPLKTTSRHPHASGSLSIGDVRLAELKRILTAQRHRAEFKGEGTLVVDGRVAVRKISDGETVVDGAPSELFYLVKKSVTDMLAKI
ncbi:hypothetical protein ZYGR_0AK02600 [Zygosaccharomyces rouxii]|uniref:Cleavage and polyadenylation specificity factor subunit 2 n=1 Tax=Zygosaccharomyces rouxii TaxID=4956 RepID=A0A1Q3ADK0_ZYGRO|nr:hypothetical protein ZYGR_0AK02600 [Zygosaccharomyces rouxii]